MWVEPNGVVRVLSGVPFNKDYENTLYFADRTAQATYFASKTKYTFPKITYQRYERNSMKLEVNCESLYDCNYLMYQNTSFGNRWFYAFITSVDYVANQVSKITYEIDEIQTWLMDCTLHESYIERAHVAVDAVGQNRVEEGIDFGEYYLRSLTPSMMSTPNFPMLEPAVIVIAVDALPSSIPQLQYYVYNGVGTGLYYFIYECNRDGVISANDLLTHYVRGGLSGGFSGVNKEDVVCIFQTPKVMWVDYNTTPTSEQSESWANNRYIPDQSTISNSPRTYNHDITIPTNLGGYEPRNKKLLQYPYNFLFVTDCRTTSNEYKYEDFLPVNNQIRFKYLLQGSCDSSMMIVPQNYKGMWTVSQGGVVGYTDNVNEKMVYKGFPQNSWSADLWQAYIAQNGGVLPLLSSDYVAPTTDVLTSVANNTVRNMRWTNGDELKFAMYHPNAHIQGDERQRERMGREGNITANSAVARTLSTLGRNIAKRTMGHNAKGNYNGDIIWASQLHDFMYGQMCITNEFAQRLDEFFDMYGYKINRIEVPNLNSRNHWNYIKTVGLNMEAPIPEDDAEAIIRIFENGIRFWKNPADNCSYSQLLAYDNVGYTRE